jgi:hypothetical protein
VVDVSRRPDPDVPVQRRCAYCGRKTTVTKPDARTGTQFSRPVHSPVRVVFPPICHEIATTFERTRALNSGGVR